MSNPTLTVPDGQWYHVVSMYGQLETSSIGGTRQVVAEIVDADANVVLITAPPETQTENTIGYYAFAPGFVAAGTSIAGNVFAQAPLPEIMLRQGYKVELAVQYTQAGDMWNSAYALVEIYTQDTTTGQLQPSPTPVLA